MNKEHILIWWFPHVFLFYCGWEMMWQFFVLYFFYSSKIEKKLWFFKIHVWQSQLTFAVLVGWVLVSWYHFFSWTQCSVDPDYITDFWPSSIFCITCSFSPAEKGASVLVMGLYLLWSHILIFIKSWINVFQNICATRGHLMTQVLSSYLTTVFFKP